MIKELNAEKLAAIDAAINRAKAGKVATSPTPVIASAASAVPHDAEREAKRQDRIAKIAADRKAREDDKLARSAQKLAQASSAPAPAHISKVEKLAATLPKLSTAGQAVYDQAAALQRSEIELVVAHLSCLARKDATIAAASTTLKVGQRVEVIGGQAKYIHAVGTVSKVQRIRCFVTLDDTGRDVYLFTSDVQPVQVAAVAPPVPEVEEVTAPVAETIAPPVETVSAPVEASASAE